MEIKKILSPNVSSRDGNAVDMIIIHSASLPEGVYGNGHITDLFMNRLDITAHPSFAELAGIEVSAHYLIERDGAVIQFADTDDKAWHAGISNFRGRDNLNLYSIGIELEGDIHTQFTDNQYEALIKLCKTLVSKYPLITKESIVRHSDVAPERKEDPGRYFDLNRVVERIFA
ncbi:1,6-anhydro-N-acetylmuramyl-L-alanine amidase AmpD [Thermodesulfobacteriota bacterium]